MTTTHPRTDAPAPPRYVYRRATRDTQDRVIGGVASGLAAHLAVPVLWVRAAFVVMTALGGAGLALYAGFWMVLPTDERFDTAAPGIESASRRGARPRRVRRLVDAGPAIAPRRARLRRAAHRPGVPRPGRALLAAAHRRRRDGAAVAAGRRGPARALARQHRPHRPGAHHLRHRRVAVGHPRGGRPAAHHRRRRRLRPAGRLDQRRHHDHAGRRGRGARARHHGGAVDLPPGRRPDRRARRAGAHAGARRHGRPPARLRAPDAGPDPEELPRLRARRPARPLPGAGPAVLALRGREQGLRHARRRDAHDRGRGRGHPRRGRRRGRAWATAPSPSRCARS